MNLSDFPNNANICGFSIVENRFLTVPGDPIEVSRTLQERWFSWPWKPFKKTRMMATQKPSPEIIMMGNCLTMHPETRRQLMAMFDKKGYKR